MSDEIPMTYSRSMARLTDLVDRLESADVDVDELETLVTEAVALITTCRTRLRATHGSVDTLLAGLKEETFVVASPSAPHLTSLAIVDDPDETDPFAAS